MQKTLFLVVLCLFMAAFKPFWGFFAHKKINRLAVFTLPPEMIGFYKKNIEYITEASVNPDRRRYSVVDEAARHYVDLDHYGDSALFKVPRYWNEAVERYSEDTLKAYGILPWHINRVYYQLRDAMMIKDPAAILRLSAELGHYISDAHVPLHTTENYNGQLTGQEGIHAFWESRLPELFNEQYDFFVGRSEYLPNTQLAAWKAITSAHLALDTVLQEEKKLALRFQEKRYAFETKGKATVKVFSQEYANAYHTLMAGMVEKQMRASIRMIGNFWYSAWIEAGQPDLKSLMNYKPTDEELEKRREELELWKQQKHQGRLHETDDAVSH